LNRFGDRKRKAKGADLGPVADQAPAIEGEIMPAKVVYADQGAVEIVDPGANYSVGQTPHRYDDNRINIDRNEGAQKAVGLITQSDFEGGNANA